MAETYGYFVGAYSLVTVIFGVYAISLWRRGKQESEKQRIGE